MARTPNEIPGASGLRDQYGRKEYLYKALNAALDPTDIQAAGSVFDADGREQIVITGISSGGGGGGGLPNGWKDVIADFGAAGDGSTNDRVAFQAAHDWAKAHNGTIYVPPAKFYAIYPDGSGNGLIFDSWAWRWTGGTGSRLIWKGGAGTAPMISIPSNPTGPWEMDHLNFTCDNTAYDGNLVSVYGAAADVQQWHMHHCEFSGWAKSLLYFKKVVIATVEYCRFVGDSDYGIWMGLDNYVTAFQVKNCMFAANNVAHIQLDNYDNEMVTITECTFEAGTNTPALVTGVNAHCANLLVEKSWCGDASGVTDWFQINGEVWYCATFIGNAIVNGAAGSHAFVLGKGHHFFFGNEVIGANTTYALKSSTGDSQVTDIGNQWQSVGSIWDGGYGSWWQFTSSPGTYPTFPPPLWNPSGQLHASGSVNDLASVGAKHGQVIFVDNSDVQVAFTSNIAPVGTILTLIADTAAPNIGPYITAGGGVTLNTPQGVTPARFRSGKSVVYAWQQAANVWYLWGDLMQHRTQWEYVASLTLDKLGYDTNIIIINAAGAQTVTVPPNSATPHVIGASIDIIQGGAGQVTIAPGAGVTLHSRGGLLHTASQYGRVQLLKRATDEWIVSGDLA